MGLIGLALAAGGVWLIALGGSAYYAITGVALCVTAALLVQGRHAGIWLYAGVFAGTVAWALWEVGGNAWALVPRIVGPAILLVLVPLVASVLRRPLFGWKVALASATGVVLVVALGFVIAAQTGPGPVRHDLPAGTFASSAPDSAASDWTAYASAVARTRCAGVVPAVS